MLGFSQICFLWIVCSGVFAIVRQMIMPKSNLKSDKKQKMQDKNGIKQG